MNSENNHSHKSHNHKTIVQDDAKRKSPNEHSERQEKKNTAKHQHQQMHGKYEGHSIEAFERRFWISLIITVFILFFSPMIQHLIGIIRLYKNMKS